jgi:DNA-binding NarL/FixJ family response regulator
MNNLKITIGVFDDHPSVIRGIEMEVVNYSATIEILFSCTKKMDLIDFTNRYLPQILILDIISEDVTGMELFETIKTIYPSIAVIAHTSLSSTVLVENLLYLGVKGFVNKQQPTSELIEAIQLVAAGKIYVPADYKYLTSKFQVLHNTLLSEREIEIVQCISDGLTSADIGSTLNISVNTIENHRKRIFHKLEVKNVAQLVKEAAKLGYLK